MDAVQPLYYKIKAALEKRIASGEFKQGDFIPCESELGECYKVNGFDLEDLARRLTAIRLETIG